ncbi:c-type cytochrome [Chloroflexi bacterium TSY]|nr:c-type cytochrome [Chloroflexi bacterium TSY]
MRKPLYEYLYVQSPITKIWLGLVFAIITLVALIIIQVTEERRMAAQTVSWEGRSIEKGAALFANNCANCHAPDGKGLPNVAPALNSKYFFTQRKDDIGWAGSLEDYVELTIHAGRPSKVDDQWAQKMPTWGTRFGGPLRDDQVLSLVRYVMNWEEEALLQGTADNPDPWQPFIGVDAPVVDEGEQEVVEGEIRAPQDLWVSLGCSGCHMLDQDQTADNRGPVGPHQRNLYERAGDRVEGLSAEEYVYQSIVNPNDYVVESYLPNIMPPNFAEKMSEEEIRGLAQWMLDPNREQ